MRRGKQHIILEDLGHKHTRSIQDSIQQRAGYVGISPVRCSKDDLLYAVHTLRPFGVSLDRFRGQLWSPNHTVNKWGQKTSKQHLIEHIVKTQQYLVQSMKLQRLMEHHVKIQQQKCMVHSREQKHLTLHIVNIQQCILQCKGLRLDRSTARYIYSAKKH